jgi:SAM-dependent methyltransferase
VDPDGLRLFLISALALFAELVFIRWYPAYILYLGYFTNFVLLGALLGLGGGALLSQHSVRLVRWLPAGLFAIVVLVLFTRAQVSPEYEEYIYFTSTPGAIALPPIVLLPLVFLSVTGIFSALGQELGLSLTRLPALQAYAVNIAGSLAGILAFTVISFLSLPAWTWFLLLALCLLPFLPRGRAFGPRALLLFGVVAVVAAADFSFCNIWSPYYRLTLVQTEQQGLTGVCLGRESNQGSHYVLQANGAGHQELSDSETRDLFYELPYEALARTRNFDEVLIVGSGGGNDVAAALGHDVGHVDAVEIDPRIVMLGQRYHPDRPYSDARVSVFVEDARAFLRHSEAQYDLIVFALPDSLVLGTGFSGVRLESFLFTREAFVSVREHLAPGGLFVLYNYFRHPWLIDRLTATARSTFGEPVVLHRYEDPLFSAMAFATIFAGPGAAEVDVGLPGMSVAAPTQITMASDDWPFPYLREPSLPAFYSLTLALILLVSVIYLRWVRLPRALARSGLPFFFMGCAFTLLEARSLVQFALLFGSTWLVNSLVFFGVLVAVLLAIAVVHRFRIRRLGPLFALLFASLLANWALPPRSLLVESTVLRYSLATALLFAPIFLANLIYGTLFRDAGKVDLAYGANLLGTMVGGSSEYMALWWGYPPLILLASGFYVLAFATVRRTGSAPPT